MPATTLRLKDCQLGPFPTLVASPRLAMPRLLRTGICPVSITADLAAGGDDQHVILDRKLDAILGAALHLRWM